MLLEDDGVNLLPYIILPIMGPEDYSVEVRVTQAYTCGMFANMFTGYGRHA